MEENKVAQTDEELQIRAEKLYPLMESLGPDNAIDAIFRELVAVRDQQQRTDYAATRAKAFRDAADMVDAGSGKNNRRDIIRELQYVAKQVEEAAHD